jgi:hypothetical protein
VDELAPRVLDEDEHVQRPERERLHGQQVHRPDAPAVVAEERPPALARRAGWAAVPVLLDGALADDDAQLQQLAADALGAPGGILPRDAGDQLADLRAQARLPSPGARPPPPAEPPASAVPANDRLGRDQGKVSAPVAPNHAGHHPEEPVVGAQARALARGPSQDGELLAQQEVLGDQIAAGSDGRAEQRDEEQDVVDHRRHDRRLRTGTSRPNTPPPQVLHRLAAEHGVEVVLSPRRSAARRDERYHPPRLLAAPVRFARPGAPSGKRRRKTGARSSFWPADPVPRRHRYQVVPMDLAGQSGSESSSPTPAEACANSSAANTERPPPGRRP